MAHLRLQFWVKPAADDIDAIVAFVRDALGCAEEPSTRKDVTVADELDRTAHTASSATRSTAGEWIIESASCSVRVEKEESFFPGDVNAPPFDTTNVVVEGTRTGGATVRVRSWLGGSDASVEVEGASSKEQDRILEKFRETFEGKRPKH